MTPIGRLKRGATLEQARVDLNQALAARPAADSASQGPVEVSPGERGAGRLRNRFLTPLQVLMAIVAVVLLAACANLGALMLTRGTARQPEIAMRLAIGASRGRIVRQLITESLLLAGLGGALGLALAAWSARLLVAMVAVDTPGLALDVGPDRWVLAFTLAMSVAAGLVFGLAPAVRAVSAGRPIASWSTIRFFFFFCHLYLIRYVLLTRPLEGNIR